MLKRIFALATVAATANTVVGDTLYAADAGGSVIQFSFSGSTLEQVGETYACGANPSWVELDQESGLLFCLNEAYQQNYAGSISSYSLNGTTPAVLGNSSSADGPVHATVYAANSVALAHYWGSAVSTFDFSDPTSLVETQRLEFTMNGTGPVSSRQDSPHPHQIITDPTGQFLVTPDLGADLLRLFRIEDDGLVELEPVSTLSGSGPRHGTFTVLGNTTYYYILGELANSLTGYEVTYTDDNLVFEQIYLDSTFQDGYGTGNGTISPAEIFAPEANHLILSTRTDNRSTWNGEGSDSLITYEIDEATGNLTLTGTTPAAGSYPRGFILNENRTLVAVATQTSGRLAIFERDVETGVLSSEPLTTWTTEEAASDGSSLLSVAWAW